MKAESTIRNILTQLKKRKVESDSFLELIKDKPMNEVIINYRLTNREYQAHIDALRWVLDNKDSNENCAINIFDPKNEHLFSNGG